MTNVPIACGGRLVQTEKKQEPALREADVNAPATQPSR
jgi:hypothetical protein